MANIRMRGGTITSQTCFRFLLLQALVLNEKPFFNEIIVCNLRRKSFREKQARVYNAVVFATSCKIMLLLMGRLPKDFEDSVEEHFKGRASLILGTCQAFINGSCYPKEDSSPSVCMKISEKSKRLTKKLYPELVVAFSRMGASVEHFVEQLNEEMKQTQKRCVAKKLYGILKKAFRLQKIQHCQKGRFTEEG